ncbi:MAG: hypothetical protein HQ523_02165 [Lentisphaerae bacterium]|nr:hypothetical protein [Lentisphaerota bacterium]
MIYENVELHNVEAIQPTGEGVRLQRVPEDVRELLDEGARMRLLQPDNCEIRFVSDSEETCVTLSSEGETELVVFHGTFDSRERHTINREPQTIVIRTPDRLLRLDPQWWRDLPFAPSVKRLVFGGFRRDPLILHGVQGAGIRPPQPEALPDVRYLAYGTSITHGFDCDAPHLSYVGQTAWHLGADLINLGVGGACVCERAFADYIAKRTDWDIATLALSVNMHLFAMPEFRERVEYMVNTVAGADTSRPVACITLFPYFRDFGIGDPSVKYGGTPDQYRQALRDVVRACPLPNVHLIEGPEILTRMGGLSGDLIHPSGHAMIEMGMNLSGRLKLLLSIEG